MSLDFGKIIVEGRTREPVSQWHKHGCTSVQSTTNLREKHLPGQVGSMLGSWCILEFLQTGREACYAAITGETSD